MFQTDVVSVVSAFRASHADAPKMIGGRLPAAPLKIPILIGSKRAPTLSSHEEAECAAMLITVVALVRNKNFRQEIHRIVARPESLEA